MTFQVKQDTELVKYLWTPDLFIYGLKSYKVAEVLNKLDALWISTDGTVLYSMVCYGYFRAGVVTLDDPFLQAVEIAVRCPVDLSYFPFDRHRCLLRVGSYAISDTKMIFVTERAGYVLVYSGLCSASAPTFLQGCPKVRLHFHEALSQLGWHRLNVCRK